MNFLKKNRAPSQTKASYTTTADRYKEQAISSLKKNPLETIIEARRLYATSKEARNFVETLVTHVAGTGLDLSPAPMWRFLPKMSDQKKKDCIAEITDRFLLFSDAKNVLYNGYETFYERDASALREFYRDGETFAILRYDDDPKSISRLKIEPIDALSVATPHDPSLLDRLHAKGHAIFYGIELDRGGREVAFYVKDGFSGGYLRVPLFDEQSGFRVGIHVAHRLYADQVRGTSILAHMAHELDKVADADWAELCIMASNASLSGYIKPSKDSGAVPIYHGVKIKNDDHSNKDDSPTNPFADVELGKPGIFIQNLAAGQEIEMLESNRPGANVQQFRDNIVHGLANSIGLNDSITSLKFRNNYSASRAELVIMFRTFEKARQMWGASYKDPIYGAWLACEIQYEGFNLQGFFDTKRQQEAWLFCYWYGEGNIDIDPLKSAKANLIMVAQGWKTHQEVTREVGKGGDWDKNMETIARSPHPLKEKKINESDSSPLQ